MKSFSQFLEENEEKKEAQIFELGKFPIEIQNQIVSKCLSIFEYLMRKYPKDSVDFLHTFSDKDEYIKSEFDSMRSVQNAFSGNPKEYGLGFVKGNFPKTGLNN